MTARLLICCAFVRFLLPCHFDFDFSFEIIAIGGDYWAIWAG
jgi:hypothetical protein